MMKTRKNFKFLVFGIIITLFIQLFFGFEVHAEPVDNVTLPIPQIGINIEAAENPQEVVTSLQILFILTILSLAPSILIMMTSFTRIVIALHFLRSALGTQQTPPNQVLIGLALFLTLFIMGPTFSEINEQALKPYTAGQISQEEAIENAMKPIRNFMFRQVRNSDLNLFMGIAQMDPIENTDDVSITDQIPSRVLIPAFIISELKTGFMIGFLLYIPFIVIDMVVASTLMSMGMMMLPPVMISLPFKILLFVMVDGWNLVIGQLVQTFR
ncbi:MAG: flagellar biosynthesis protein FliP [Epulopiscium sp.]|uniref:Flagellar biosynthetic protein FliP n=2 Tax=Defluviitalea raffinosedens TaxID=1450156 RepID=A0A7C8HJF8_9FIRM|nr:flagellar type III secretion system pore protein FliP [Defluviitalea raffinosedens]MDK2787161.1 flagellar biosynthesis protein FliP [Candidatus Epulonipiscium sp.]HHW67368.1 flagellar type III secretion system pore protein FliP [Candidatus Epulonipiscium sp.]